MLKWLRKYNTWILVIGGSLLMIAFLLPQAIQELGKGRLSGPLMKFKGGRASQEDLARAYSEYRSIRELLSPRDRDILQIMARVENAEHWYLLAHEATEAGLVGSVDDGKSMLDSIAEDLATGEARMRGGDPVENKRALLANIELALPKILGETRLTPDGFYEGMAKFKGILRMRSMMIGGARLSDRRLALGATRISNAALVDYVVYPAERDAASIPEPTDADITAHYDQYKNTLPGQGEFGFGYKQPDRIKLTWLQISRVGIENAVSVDAIEVEKQFLRMYPTGTPPANLDAAAERGKIQRAVLNKQADEAMKTAEQAVRGEFERPIRKLAPDGEFKRVPSDWVQPDFNVIAQTVVDRVAERHNITIPKPNVVVESRWLTYADLGPLPSIGLSFARLGNRSEPFATVAFNVRELGADTAGALQKGLPRLEPLTDNGQNRYFLMVTDARKSSEPESINEVRTTVVQDLRRLRAFTALKARADEFRDIAAKDNGLEELAKSSAPNEADPMTVKHATIDTANFSPPDAAANTEDVRKAAIAAASSLDPTTDPALTPLAKRVVIKPVSKSLSLVVARINSLKPVTVESLRTLENTITDKLLAEEIPKDSVNPFGYAAMKKRLNVEFPQRQNNDAEADDANAPKKTS